jgi:hypothetical protein
MLALIIKIRTILTNYFSIFKLSFFYWLVNSTFSIKSTFSFKLIYLYLFFNFSSPSIFFNSWNFKLSFSFLFKNLNFSLSLEL